MEAARRAAEEQRRWAIQNERARLQAVADAESAALAKDRENHNKAHAMRRRVFKGLFLRYWF